MVCLSELRDAVDEGKEMRAKPPKGLDDTGNDCFALGGGVAGSLVCFTGIRRKAGG